MSELVFNRVILEKNNRVLMLIAMISLFVNLLLLFGLMWSYQRPPLLVFSQDGEISVLQSKSLKSDETSLTNFAKFISSQYLSFTSDSLPIQIENIKPYLAQRPIQVMLNSYKFNQALIQKVHISQYFTIKSVIVTKKSDPYWLELNGVRNIQAGNSDKSVPMTYVMEIKKIRPSQINPYGLLMSDIIQKGDLKDGGKL